MKTLNEDKITRKRKQYTPDQAEGALEDVSCGMSVKQAAKKWSVPRSTLQDLKIGKYHPMSRPGPATILTDEEELLLVQWITELARRGVPLSKENLLDSVQSIVISDGRLNPFSEGRPGKVWFYAFIKGHPEIAQRNPESICRGRGSLTEGCIRGWFLNAEKFFKEKNIEYVLLDPCRQCNGDETGFQIDPKSNRVIGPRGEVVYTESDGNKEQVTVLITTRAEGSLFKSAIVYPYKRAIPLSIVTKLPSGFSAARSDSGWMTSSVFYEYMANTFIPELGAIRRQQKGLSDDEELVLGEDDWVVYWMDG